MKELLIALTVLEVLVLIALLRSLGFGSPGPAVSASQADHRSFGASSLGLAAACVLVGAAVIAYGASRLYPIEMDDVYAPFGGEVFALAALVGFGCAIALVVGFPPVGAFSVVGVVVALGAVSFGSAAMASDWGYYHGYQSDPWFLGCSITAGLGLGVALAVGRSAWHKRMLTALAGGAAGTLAAVVFIFFAALSE